MSGVLRPCEHLGLGGGLVRGIQPGVVGQSELDAEPGVVSVHSTPDLVAVVEELDRVALLEQLPAETSPCVLGGTDAGTNLFSTYPAGLDANGAIQLYPSQELAADFRSQQDTLWSEGPPGWLVIDAGQNEAYWLQRDGALHIAAIHTTLPDLLAMHLQKTSDHVQNQPDYPHARAHLLGWHNAGHAWFRLNPDAAYMMALMDTETAPSNLPDNDANTLVQWPDPGPQMVPDQYGQILKLAGILELADRVHFSDNSPNLNALLTVYNDDTSTSAPGTGNPDLACEPGQTAMCCGDGVCDGPETQLNCPEDCTEGTGDGDGQTDCKPGATACCGNQVCEGPENAQNCSEDCSR